LGRSVNFCLNSTFYGDDNRIYPRDFWHNPCNISFRFKKEQMSPLEFEIKYVELKSGYADNGPAWIGRVKNSKTGNTVYFNNKAFRRHVGVGANYYDVETLEEYWISNVKKDGTDRHWAGSGKVMIDRKIISDYLSIIGEKQLNRSRFEVVELDDVYPIDRVYRKENSDNGAREC
jgi:hypothetical protein